MSSDRVSPLKPRCIRNTPFAKQPLDDTKFIVAMGAGPTPVEHVASETVTDEIVPAVKPPSGTATDWSEKVRRAIEVRQAAEHHWQGKNPVSRQTWPIYLHHG